MHNFEKTNYALEMEKVKARLAIKLKVPQALTKFELENLKHTDNRYRAITLHMGKHSISQLRLAYEIATKNCLESFSFQGNTWLTKFAKTALTQLESEFKKRGW